MTKIDLDELKTVHDAKQELVEIDGQMTALLDKAKQEDRALSGKEKKEYDQMMTNLRAVSDHHDFLQAEKERRLIVAAKKFESAGKGFKGETQNRSGYYDLKTGKQVPVVGREDRAVDVFATEDQKKLSVGRAIRALLTDDWTQAKEERSALATSSAGGLLVPRGVLSTVIDNARAKSVCFQAGANVVGLSDGTMAMAKIGADPQMEVKAENELFNVETANLDAVLYSPKTIGTVITMSREIARDADNAHVVIEHMLSSALATYIDYLMLAGDGTGQNPTGILHKSGVSEVAVGGNAPHYGHLLHAWKKLSENNADPRTVIMHPQDQAYLASMYESSFGWINAPDLLQKMQWLSTTQLPIDGGVGDDESSMIMGDFNYMFMGLRENSRIELDYWGDRFNRHQVGVKITLSADFQVMRDADFCKITGATSPGDFWDINFDGSDV